MTAHFLIAMATLLLLPQSKPEKYSCGEKKYVLRSYGKVELRVDCETTKGYMWVAEYKGNSLHGMSQGFRVPSGTKEDSCFYRNNERHGTCLVWDSLGNVVGRSTFRNGKQIGKLETYFAVGRPAIIQHFNNKGEKDGPWEEWWPNGSKKAEFIARRGQIIKGAEFYQNGKPRVRYLSKYEPMVKSVFKTKFNDGEAWAPDGRSAGKIINGQGEWLLFPDGRDSTDRAVFREVYKDSLMIKGEKLDSAEVARWFR